MGKLNIPAIVSGELKAERIRIYRAIAALEGPSHNGVQAESNAAEPVGNDEETVGRTPEESLRKEVVDVSEVFDNSDGLAEGARDCIC